MARGKLGAPKTKICNTRLPESMMEELERIGDGNRTEGIRVIYKYYMARHDASQKDDTAVVSRIHEHIHAPDSPALREKYLLFIDEWHRSEKIWNAPMVYNLMGITKTNKGSVKQFLKSLVSNGFIEYSSRGFKPVIRSNGGWTQEEFSMEFKEYIRILQS